MNNISLKTKTRLRLTWKTGAFILSIATIVTWFCMSVVEMGTPKQAYAVACDNTYLLDWSIPSTYVVTCGDVNSANWSVKGKTCFYNSPVLAVGGSVGGPDKLADILVRVNQSGNLDNNDTAWVYMYTNGSLNRTYTCVGGISSAVFTISQTITVPAGGTYNIVVKLMNDKTNELWQIKNGDVTTCVHAITPLPIALGSFTAKAITEEQVQIKWTTYSEINNDYFTLERSTNGVEYVKVATVDGAGNSNSLLDYTFTDKHPANGMNYYRLKQTDFDGVSTTSFPTNVQVTKDIKRTKPLLVYPNPFTTIFSAKFDSEFEQEVEASLLNMNGTVILKRQQHVTEGWNTFSYPVPSDLKSGMYVIQLSSGSKIIGSTRVIRN